jgi:glycosidase
MERIIVRACNGMADYCGLGLNGKCEVEYSLPAMPRLLQTLRRRGLLLALVAAGCIVLSRPAPAAEWIIYEVFVRQFSEAGTLAAVEARLDEIAELGVDVIWLMPIHPIGEVERKGTVGSPYAVRDYRSIHPDLGGPDDLKRLVAAAHARGLKLIIDWVPNHTAWDHPWLAEHPDWYHRDEHGRPRPPIPVWNDVVHLDYGAPALRREMEEIMAWWIREFDIDGYRVDVAGMVPNDFWPDVIPRLRAIKPGLILLAEAVGPVYHELGFDLSYDDPLRNLLWRVAHRREPAGRVHDYVASARERYPAGAVLMRFAENHDLDRTAQAFPAPTDGAAIAAVFTLPGVPLIFAGQERGIAHRPELFEKDPVPWTGGRPEALDFHRALIRLRKDHPALARGSWRALAADSDRALTFLRAHEDETIVVILNFSTEDLGRVTIRDLPEGWGTRGFVDLLDPGSALLVAEADGESLVVPMGTRPARLLQSELPSGPVP